MSLFRTDPKAEHRQKEVFAEWRWFQSYSTKQTKTSKINTSCSVSKETREVGGGGGGDLSKLVFYAHQLGGGGGGGEENSADLDLIKRSNKSNYKKRRLSSERAGLCVVQNQWKVQIGGWVVDELFKE